jgi:hypothetical protein
MTLGPELGMEETEKFLCHKNMVHTKSGKNILSIWLVSSVMKGI